MPKGALTLKPPPQPEPPLADFACTLAELLAMDIPEREMVIDNFIRTQSITMIYAHRGLGKTWFALSMAVAVARGEDFVGYRVPKPRPVIFFDGEMPLADTQERGGQLVGGDPPENLTFVSSERLALGGRSPICLNERPSQLAILAFLEDYPGAVIFFDNLSALTGVGMDENSNSDMTGMMKFFIELRHLGFTVIFVHHTGKDAVTQRGASKKEDAIDTSIFLEAVQNSHPDGAEFKMSFTKLRGRQPSPREQVLTLRPDEHGTLGWETSVAHFRRFTLMLEHVHSGKVKRQVDLIELLQMTKGAVSKLVRDAKKQGLLEDAEGLKLTTEGLKEIGELPF